MGLMCNKVVPLHEIEKGTNCLLNLCFYVLVAECITFDAYTGIAIHGFLITANSSNCLYMYIQVAVVLFLFNRS